MYYHVKVMSKKCNVRVGSHCVRYLIIDSEKWHQTHRVHDDCFVMVVNDFRFTLCKYIKQAPEVKTIYLKCNVRDAGIAPPPLYSFFFYFNFYFLTPVDKHCINHCVPRQKDAYYYDYIIFIIIVVSRNDGNVRRV